MSDLVELFESYSFTELVGGAIIIFFLTWQIIEKAFGNIDWIKNRRETKEKIQKEKRNKEVTELITQQIIPPILKEIEDINEQQTKKLDKLIESSNDTMRVELTRIYFKYQKYKQIPQWAYESATHLYDDYVAQDGNTFVKGLWEQMRTWEVVPNETRFDK